MLHIIKINYENLVIHFADLCKISDIKMRVISSLKNRFDYFSICFVMLWYIDLNCKLLGVSTYEWNMIDNKRKCKYIRYVTIYYSVMFRPSNDVYNNIR